MVENHIGFKMNMLRSNNKGEYNSNEFNAYCTKYGIKRQFTFSYTS